jgi:hypothetical protein
MTATFPRLLLIAGAACALGSCKREEIRVYLAPKDQPPPARNTAASATPSPRPRPQLTWTLPAGWKEASADQMSVANFTVGEEAAGASVNITPLPNLEGREAMVINMWREQVGQPALEEAEVGAALSDVEVAGQKGKLFEIAGERDGKPQRTITAMQHTPEASWFYKISGDEAVVAAQKPAFLEFLKSVRMTAPATAAKSEPAPAPEPTPQQFRWSVPPAWTAQPAGQMQVAKFAVPEQGSAKAEVTVSIFPNDTGGTRANVDRWRRQIGLAEADDTAMAQTVSPLDPALPGAELVDLANGARRIVGAIVPRDGRWWFYKLMGDADAVAAAREPFISFAKSQP